MAAPSKLPLPIKALAALTTIPVNVFCNYLANIVAGGWTAMHAVDSTTLVAAAAVAGLFGWIRHLTNRDEKEREQLARAIRAIKCDVQTASDLIEGIAKGRIEVSFTIDELMKSEIEDACRRIVAAPTNGLSAPDAVAILEAVYETTSQSQASLESLKTDFDGYREVSEMLSWTLDHRMREHGTILLNIQELVDDVAAQCPALIRIEEKLDEVHEIAVIVRDEQRQGFRDMADALQKLTTRSEEQIAAYLRPIIEKEVDAKRQAEFEQQRRNTDESVAILIKSVLRASNVPGLIEELRKTGDGRKIFEALCEVSTHSNADYIEVHRGIAAWAFFTGAIAAAERSLNNILHLLPDDLDAINRLGRIHFLRGTLDEAKSCFERVLKLSADDPEWEAVAHGNLGELYRTSNEPKRAEESYRKALSIYLKLGDRKGIAQTLDRRGVLLRVARRSQGRRHFGEAAELHLRAMEIFKDLGDQVGIAICSGHLGVIYRNLGQLDEAERLFHDALVIDEKLGRAVAIATDLSNLGLVYQRRNEFTKAEQVFVQSLTRSEQIGSLRGIAAVCRNLVAIYIKLEEPEHAEQMLDRALPIEGKLERKHIAAQNPYGTIAQLYIKTGKLERAACVIEKALAIDKNLGRIEGMASRYRNLGVAYFTRGDLDGAEVMYKKALAIDEKLGRLEGMANAYGNLGNVYMTRGDLDGTEAMYKKALAINEKLGRPKGMAYNYGKLGVVYFTRGDLNGAEAMHKMALAIFEKLGHLKGMAANYTGLGNVCSARGDLDEAEAMYKKALAIDEKLGRPEGMAVAYSNLGNICYTRGDVAATRDYWTRSRDLYAHIFIPHEILKLQACLDSLPPAAASALPP